MYGSKTNTDLLLAMIVAVLIYMMFCRGKSAIGQPAPPPAPSPAPVLFMPDPDSQPAGPLPPMV
jgi:hypothetical protein